MAFTRDLLTTFPIGGFASYRGENKRYTVSYEIEFTASNSLAQNEIIRITQLPTGVGITTAMVRVVTANADVTDIDIGFGTGSTTTANIFDGISLASTGYLAANNLTVTNGASYMTATNNISLTNKDATTLQSGKIQVILEVVNFAGATI